MKEKFIYKIFIVISIICCVVGLNISLCGLAIGLQSMNSEGWNRLGTILIVPSVIIIIGIVLDFLITIDKIKKGLIYSCITSLIKIVIIALLIPGTISEYRDEMNNILSNFRMYLVVIIILVIITIPSVINTIKFFSLRKNE